MSARRGIVATGRASTRNRRPSRWSADAGRAPAPCPGGGCRACSAGRHRSRPRTWVACPPEPETGGRRCARARPDSVGVSSCASAPRGRRGEGDRADRSERARIPVSEDRPVTHASAPSGARRGDAGRSISLPVTTRRRACDERPGTSVPVVPASVEAAAGRLPGLEAFQQPIEVVVDEQQPAMPLRHEPLRRRVVEVPTSPAQKPPTSSAPIGFAWRPSWAHDRTSASSSSVPRPPGSAMNASESSAITAFRSWSVVDDPQLAHAGMGQLAVDEPGRDHADHPTAGRQRRVGDGAHQPETAAAVDELDPAPGEPCPDRGRGRPRSPGRVPALAPQNTQIERRAGIASEPQLGAGSATSGGPRGRDARSRSSPRPTTGRASGRRAAPPRARRSGRSRTRRSRAAPSRSGRGRFRGRAVTGIAAARPGVVRAGRAPGRRRSGRRAGSGGSPSSAARSFALFSASVASRRRSAGSGRPGPPPSASTSRPESSASVGRPVAPRREAGLDPGVRLERRAGLVDVAVDRRGRRGVTSSALGHVEQVAQLRELVGRVRRDDEARTGRRRDAQRLTVARTSAWAANSCSSPDVARSIRPSIAARSNGLPSAVPWTSTNVPASVPTTLKSTSARESSL